MSSSTVIVQVHNYFLIPFVRLKLRQYADVCE